MLVDVTPHSCPWFAMNEWNPHFLYVTDARRTKSMKSSKDPVNQPSASFVKGKTSIGLIERNSTDFWWAWVIGTKMVCSTARRLCWSRIEFCHVREERAVGIFWLWISLSLTETKRQDNSATEEVCSSSLSLSVNITWMWSNVFDEDCTTIKISWLSEKSTIADRRLNCATDRKSVV